MKKYLNKISLHYFLISIIFISAFFLRLYHINNLSLWRDEAFTAILVQKNLGELIPILINDTSSFLHQIFLHFWVQLFGAGEISLRLPSLIFNMLTLLYLYLISRKFFKRPEQIAIIALFSVNIISIFYSQEARVYSMFTFLLLSAFYYLINLIEKFSFRSALLWVLFNSLAFYSHNLAMFFIATEAIYVALKLLQKLNKNDLLKSFKKNSRLFIQWIVTFLSFFVISIPWIIIFITQASKFQGGFWLTFHPIDTLNETLTGLATGIRLITSRPFTIFDALLNLSTIAFTLIGTFSEMLNFKKQKVHFTVFFWLPFIMMYFVSFFSPVLYTRYVSFLSPFMIILVFKGIKTIFKSKYIQLSLIGLLIILNLNIYFSDLAANTTSKANYKELVQYIEHNLSTNDNVIHMRAHTFFPVKYYSKDKFHGTIYDPNFETPFYIGSAMILEEDYTRDLSAFLQYDRLWIIELSDTFAKEEFEPSFTLEEEKEFEGGLYLQLWGNKAIEK